MNEAVNDLWSSESVRGKKKESWGEGHEKGVRRGDVRATVVEG